MRLGLRQATLKLGDQWILDGADFQLHPGERIGLIGQNGAGKTTLLNILTGRIPLDSGERVIASGVQVGGVIQAPVFDDSATIAETVALGLGEAGHAWVCWQRLLNADQQAEDYNDALAEAQYAMDQHQAWDVEARVGIQLNAWRLPASSLIAGLSGGERKRVALAQAWIAQPEILFLDEPTNHLDLPGIRQLEQAAVAYPGCIVCISHDRAFLDAIVTRILELDRGYLSAYPGNYARYLEQKEKRLEEESVHQARFDKFLAQEEVWIRKGVEARRTRNEGRVRRLERLRDERRARREQRQLNSDWTLVSGDRSGKQVVVMDDVSYTLPDGRTLLSHFTTRFIRGDRVGIVGPNGVGKSTLIKLILGQIEPTEGTVEQGTRLTVAYFDQMREQLDGQKTVLEMVSPGSEWIEWNGERIHRMGYLLQFGFSPKQVNQPVRSLSGGERQRLLLARLFTQPANVLVLDEPTNDLDMETLDILEATLQRYDGTVFLVTHDRQFLDNVVTQMAVFQADGSVREYPGGFSDWDFWEDWYKAWDQAKSEAAQQYKAEFKESLVSTPPRAVAAQQEPSSTASDTLQQQPFSVPPRPLSRKEQDELAKLPEQIESLELRLTQIQTQLGDPALYAQPAAVQQARVAELNASLSELEGQKQRAYARWEALESRF
jgi:ABC transport system ATP-binding/permease protein